MRQSKDSHIIPMTSVSSGKGREVRSDIFYYTDQIVNLVFIGEPAAARWWLVDAGMPGSSKSIIKEAEERYGENKPPQAIILTHGHFDHVGSIVDLLEHWPGTPVFAHQQEFPFLTGRQDYPEPDNTVEGGLLAKISSIYPHRAINIEPVLRPLDADGTVSGLNRWQWIHTPGHTPGHISLFRESDGVLIAGDAFITVRQDSMYKVLVQKEEVNGPPRYLTTDWTAAKQSVRTLMSLNPQIAITGHGTCMKGPELSEGLQELASNFDEVAVPDHGRFVYKDKTDH